MTALDKSMHHGQLHYSKHIQWLIGAITTHKGKVDLDLKDTKCAGSSRCNPTALCYTQGQFKWQSIIHVSIFGSDTYKIPHSCKTCDFPEIISQKKFLACLGHHKQLKRTSCHACLSSSTQLTGGIRGKWLPNCDIESCAQLWLHAQQLTFLLMNTVHADNDTVTFLSSRSSVVKLNVYCIPADSHRRNCQKSWSGGKIQ